MDPNKVQVRAKRTRSSAIVCNDFELENVRFGAKDRPDHPEIMPKGYHARAGLSQYWSKACSEELASFIEYVFGKVFLRQKPFYSKTDLPLLLGKQYLETVH